MKKGHFATLSGSGIPRGVGHTPAPEFVYTGDHLGQGKSFELKGVSEFLGDFGHRALLVAP